MNEATARLGRRDLLKLTGLGLLGMGAVPLLTSCGDDATATGGSLRIAALFPISGPLALLGEESWRGVEIATKQRNAGGGVAGKQIEIVKADVPDVNAATSEARRLVTKERIQLGIGTYSSSLALAASEVFARSNASYFEVGSIANDITGRGYKTVWRTNPTSQMMATVQTDFIKDWAAPALGKDLASINLIAVHEDSAYGSSVARFLKDTSAAVGIKNFSAMPYNAQSTDLSSTVLGLKSAKPDIVIAVSYLADAILLGRQIQQFGVKIPICIGGGGGHTLSSFAEALGAAADGVFDNAYTQYAVNKSYTPGLDDFVAAYEELYGESPRSGHSLANYMGAQVMYDIVEAADGDLASDALGAAAASFEKEPGTTATGWGVKFDDTNQNVLATSFVTQWKGGKSETVWPPEAAVRTPELITPFGV